MRTWLRSPCSHDERDGQRFTACVPRAAVHRSGLRPPLLRHCRGYVRGPSHARSGVPGAVGGARRTNAHVTGDPLGLRPYQCECRSAQIPMNVSGMCIRNTEYTKATKNMLRVVTQSLIWCSTSFAFFSQTERVIVYVGVGRSYCVAPAANMASYRVHHKVDIYFLPLACRFMQEFARSIQVHVIVIRASAINKQRLFL